MLEPIFSISPGVARALMKIEAARQRIVYLPITPTLIGSLRETARLQTTHYSTQIEGNRLTQKEVEEVIEKAKHLPGKERDEREVLGLYSALDFFELVVKEREGLTEQVIQTFHALVMGGGKRGLRPSLYRDGQNVIRDGGSGRIVYLPPEAKDLPLLMGELVSWISEQEEYPAPIVAAVAHYQFATIHPYYDGNGRTARLLTTLILHLSGYGLKGLFSLEEYYAKNLPAYYEALAVGPSHNYYMGRAEADISNWVEYFCRGVADSFEKVCTRAEEMRSTQDQTAMLVEFDVRQRRVLELFEKEKMITAIQVAGQLQLNPRTARALCLRWVR